MARKRLRRRAFGGWGIFRFGRRAGARVGVAQLHRKTRRRRRVYR